MSSYSLRVCLPSLESDLHPEELLLRSWIQTGMDVPSGFDKHSQTERLLYSCRELCPFQAKLVPPGLQGPVCCKGTREDAKLLRLLFRHRGKWL